MIMQMNGKRMPFQRLPVFYKSLRIWLIVSWFYHTYEMDEEFEYAQGIITRSSPGQEFSLQLV